LHARTDLGEPGQAVLRIGEGRVGRVLAELQVVDGAYRATVSEIVLGEEPQEGLAQQDAEPLVAAGTEEDLEQDAPEDEDVPIDPGHPTNPSGRTPPDRDRTGIHVEDSLKTEGAELLADIPLHIAVELARLRVTAEEVVALRVGEVLDLGKAPGEPVELSVNGKIVARGELVEVEGHLGVRVLSLTG
jgi:type III secretion system YscQ/HrcQ family protein